MSVDGVTTSVSDMKGDRQAGQANLLMCLFTFTRSWDVPMSLRFIPHIQVYSLRVESAVQKIFIYIVCACSVSQSCLSLCHPMPTSLSMGFSRQAYWSGLPFPTPGDLRDPGIKPASPALAGRFFTTAPPEKPSFISMTSYFKIESFFNSIYNPCYWMPTLCQSALATEATQYRYNKTQFLSTIEDM